MKKRNQILAAFLAVVTVLAGCGQTPAEAEKPEEAPAAAEAPAETPAETPAAPTEEAPAAEPTAAEEPAEAALEDGVYLAQFNTDSSMFHINEAYEGKGTLTVEQGEMTMHIVLPSKNTVNLFYGLAEDAQKEGAVLLQPVVETVTYPDGLSEEVHAFDIPVPYLDQEFDLALIGTKEVWYDHKVSVSDPVPAEEAEAAEPYVLEDGIYRLEVTLEGGSGRASITSPTELTVLGGAMFLDVEWSSPNYDYMKIGDKRYDPINTSGNSRFLLTVHDLNAPLEVVADTVAMSEPHEIEYTIIFDIDSIEKKE